MVVGVSVVKRSDDKAVRAGNPSAGFGILSVLATRIAGKPAPAEPITWK